MTMKLVTKLVLKLVINVKTAGMKRQGNSNETGNKSANKNGNETGAETKVYRCDGGGEWAFRCFLSSGPSDLQTEHDICSLVKCQS